MLAVVIFHAFPKHLSGGFAGVDVFFVISGFLITCIIDKGLKRGDFEFSDFWARRIRRIFPALLTVTITTLIAGWWYLLPAEFENLKSHIKWGLAFAANFKLNSEVGYFDVAAELKPQLHLWSLAIEEQFYLFWPALLWICFRQRINPFTATLLLGYYSYQSRKFFSTTASESFYFPWTRFWELQAGALLAFWNADYAQRFSELWNRFEKYIRPLVLSTTASNDGHTTTELFKSVMSFTGISLVAWSCFSFTKATPFPSRSTLYPVLGAVLIIAAGKDAWFNRWILSLRPLRFVGKISFPLYLWHWPILSFVRIILGEPNFKVALCAVGLSFALSIFTYFFIEQRLRFDIGRVAWKAPTLTAALCGLILVLKLLNIKSANTLKSNLGTIINGPSEAIFAPCPKSLTKEGPQALGYCAQTRTVPKPSIAIIGDSHAHHLMHGFSKLSPENILLVGHSSCPPVLTKQFYTPHCVLKNRAILDYMESNEG